MLPRMAELDSQPKSIQSLYTWYAEGRLWVNRRYQRKLVWTLVEKQKLVESTLKKYPIPAILLAERDNGEYEVIDGLQRIHTLMSFIEMGFPTEDGKRFDVAQFPTANTRAAEGTFEVIAEPNDGGALNLLTPREVGTFLDYSMAVSVMRGSTDADIDDVFARINTYGHRLSDQERRQAGVQNEFSTLVRDLSCDLRGDTSSQVLALADMPSISIDLPMARHGYQVAAGEVFWVEQGILRATDLRDSMDEQCVADIAASVVGGTLIARSRDALDQIYQEGTPESERISAGLDGYGMEKVSAEFKYIIDEIRRVGATSGNGKLRNLLFSKQTTNPFPAVFAVLFIAFHELLIGEAKQVADYEAVCKALTDLDRRVDTSRGSTSPADRRLNVDTIKGLIRPHLVDGEHADIYGEHTAIDIDGSIRRSHIEAPHYELKQGLLRLDDSRSIDPNILNKIVETVCAIANNGKDRAGTLLVGVADKDADAARVKHLYNIEPRKVGKMHVVGVRREAEALSESVEDYFGRFKTAIRASDLSEPLKSDVLSSVAYTDYFGLGVVIIRVPPQKDVSLVGDRVFIRASDETVEVHGPASLLDVGKRFR